MQFQVPQFVEVKDKIVGPLTLKQASFIAAAFGASFLLYFFLNPAAWFILSALALALAVAFAFVKVNGLPFEKIVVSATKFYWFPQTYVWQPENPLLPKNESTLRNFAAGFSPENIIAGMALKHAWQEVQTGSKASWRMPRFPRMMPTKEGYQIYQRIRGERRAARRVDYR